METKSNLTSGKGVFAAAAGDNVEICDGSEAHGDKGTVLWVQTDGLIIVELEAGCCWPVEAHEIKTHNESRSATAQTNPHLDTNL